MSTLHTVNKSPFERNALKSCLDHLSRGDTVLLIEDGGDRRARKGGAAAMRTLADARLHDLRARRRSGRARPQPDDVVEGMHVVDYGGFVDLVPARPHRGVALTALHAKTEPDTKGEKQCRLIRSTAPSSSTTRKATSRTSASGHKDLAGVIAKAENIDMTREHWEVVNFLRDYYEEYQIAPAIRILVKEMKKKFGPEKGDQK